MHFSFLRDLKVHGFYYNNIRSYLTRYPSVRKEHYHDFYSILLCKSGNGRILINNNFFDIQPQTICLISPKQLHSYESFWNIDGTVLLFCQDFYVEEFSFIRLLNTFSYTARIDGNLSNPFINLSGREYGLLSDILKSIEREYEDYTASNNSSTIIRSLLNILLLKVTELFGKISGIPQNGEHVIIHELSRMVDFNFITEHQTAFYTSAINVSEKQLNDICNRHFSCGLKKILTDRLMQEARKLLMSSDLSVSEISFKLNFDDNSYFNKVFKKQTGLTPKRFREIHKNLVP